MKRIVERLELFISLTVEVKLCVVSIYLQAANLTRYGDLSPPLSEGDLGGGLVSLNDPELFISFTVEVLMVCCFHSFTSCNHKFATETKVPLSRRGI